MALTSFALGLGAATSNGATEHTCVGADCVGPSAVAAAAAAAPARITPSGVGAVRLRRTYMSLRRAGSLGKLITGCELGGPRTRSATLRAPLSGHVDLTLRSPRRVATILVRGGATARGIGIGATSARVRRAFPGAKIDHRGDAVLGLTIVRVPRGAGGRLEFGVDTKTKRVTLIGIPRIPVCD
ncbi:MAG: hypothetical protein Q8K79_17575 [Solirubrobacteraceae bacterium]|nr:hypothetical protein [Solirubrobacteraceae bacterium]